jgi:hypothetical protein
MITCQIQKLSEDEAIDIITKPLQKKEGFFHLWIGYSGCGKTVANATLCQAIIERGLMTVVVDQKNVNCIYPGTQVAGISEMVRVKDRSVVLRGPALTRKATDIVDFNKLANKVWSIGQGNVGSCLCMFPDELYDACSSGQTWKTPKRKRQGNIAEEYEDSWMDKLYRQGRVLGLCISAGTQLVQEIPRSAMAMTATKAYFYQESREISYLERLGYLTSDESAVVSTLKNGEFLLTERGGIKGTCKFDYQE